VNTREKWDKEKKWLQRKGGNTERGESLKVGDGTGDDRTQQPFRNTRGLERVEKVQRIEKIWRGRIKKRADPQKTIT